MGDPGGVPNAAWKDLMVAAQMVAGDTPGEPKEMSAEVGLNFLWSLIFLCDFFRY